MTLVPHAQRLPRELSAMPVGPRCRAALFAIAGLIAMIAAASVFCASGQTIRLSAPEDAIDDVKVVGEQYTPAPEQSADPLPSECNGSPAASEASCRSAFQTVSF